MTVRVIPAVEAATYIHTGDPHRINDRLLDVEQWVEANGCVLASSLRLVYGRAIVERLPMEEWTFEVQYPITTVTE